jgi:release factor glutamine methyltransferase
VIKELRSEANATEDEVDPMVLGSIMSDTEELSKGKPVQYVLGEADFCGMKFSVNSSVLIPRQETEELVHLIIGESSLDAPVILDIGTGSGCIAITLAKFIKGSVVVATDVSEGALNTAKRNAERNGAEVMFLLDDITNSRLTGSFDIIVSNPPYVTNSEMAQMQMNVVSHEPWDALFVSDSDPLVYYRAIADAGKRLLNEKGRIYLEINERFGKEVRYLFLNAGYVKAEVIKDINGKDRILKVLAAAEWNADYAD